MRYLPLFLNYFSKYAEEYNKRRNITKSNLFVKLLTIVISSLSIFVVFIITHLFQIASVFRYFFRFLNSFNLFCKIIYIKSFYTLFISFWWISPKAVKTTLLYICLLIFLKKQCFKGGKINKKLR